MDYFEICIRKVPEETRDILVSLLAEEGFESFMEDAGDLKAYVPVTVFQRDMVEAICRRFHADHTERQIPDQNWNREWEKNFNPVTLTDQCHIRAPFHPARPEFRFEIIIEPKMSFGTAHHETTALMIEAMLKVEVKGKRVLDMGCGTGILAILADKMGAESVMAIDNDPWAFENTGENVGKNRSLRVTIRMGDFRMADGVYDIILANINRNVLLEQIPAYPERMAKPGILLLSGFYEEDIPAIREAAFRTGFEYDCHTCRNHWVAMQFRKG